MKINGVIAVIKMLAQLQGENAYMKNVAFALIFLKQKNTQERLELYL